MLTAKTALLIITMAVAAYQPMLAEQTQSMPALPWGAQLGVIGMMGGLLWWQIAKVMPAADKRRSDDFDRFMAHQKECNENNNECITGMAKDIKEMTKGTHELNTTIKTLRIAQNK